MKGLRETPSYHPGLCSIPQELAPTGVRAPHPNVSHCKFGRKWRLELLGEEKRKEREIDRRERSKSDSGQEKGSCHRGGPSLPFCVLHGQRCYSWPRSFHVLPRQSCTHHCSRPHPEPCGRVTSPHAADTLSRVWEGNTLSLTWNVFLSFIAH